MSDNMAIWNKLKQPPASALRQIQAGRLKGKTDISPQWRYQAMCEVFGPCGDKWKYTVDKLWLEPADKEIVAFALVSVSYVLNTEGLNYRWSEPVPGIGGSMLLESESRGLHVNDEAYKMAVTDALSVALKMLGVASDIYMGLWDGTKYINKPADPPKQTPPPTPPPANPPPKQDPPKDPPNQDPLPPGTPPPDLPATGNEPDPSILDKELTGLKVEMTSMLLNMCGSDEKAMAKFREMRGTQTWAIPFDIKSEKNVRIIHAKIKVVYDQYQLDKDIPV